LVIDESPEKLTTMKLSTNIIMKKQMKGNHKNEENYREEQFEPKNHGSGVSKIKNGFKEFLLLLSHFE
jgi:hypothetical protein